MSGSWIHRLLLLASLSLLLTAKSQFVLAFSDSCVVITVPQHRMRLCGGARRVSRRLSCLQTTQTEPRSLAMRGSTARLSSSSATSSDTHPLATWVHPTAPSQHPASPLPPRGMLLWARETTSTMSLARELAPQVAAASPKGGEWTSAAETAAAGWTFAVAAEQQTGGKGTKGRSWFGLEGNVFLTVR